MEKLQGVKKPANVLMLFAVLCFASYVVYSLYFNIIGANAAVMMDYFQITDGQQGFILTMQSIGALAATFLIALFGEQFNKVKMIVCGLAVMGACSLLIGGIPYYAAMNGYTLILIFVIGAGFGFTLIDIMVNSSLTDVFPQQSNTMVPMAHAFHGLGAMVSPLVITVLVNPQVAASFAKPYMVYGIAMVAVFAVMAVATKKITPATPYADMREIRGKAKENPAEIFRTKESWILLAACVTYFAFQIGMSAWLPKYCISELKMDFADAGRMVTFFFGGALVMRFCLPLFLKKMKAKHIYVANGFIACILMGIALFVTDTAVFRVLLIIVGFLQGAQATLLVIISCAVFPTRTASAASLITMAIGIASLVFPFLMGNLAELMGYRVSLMLINVVFACSTVIILLLGRKNALK